jgi:hypothetical protein
MTIKLTTPLRREIEIDGEPFTLVLSPEGIRLTRTRFRAGRTVSWRAFWEQGEDEPERQGGGDGRV